MHNLKKLIIEEASSWLSTNFHHQGRIKKNEMHDGGCDCIGLIIGIAKNLNLKSRFDVNKNISEFDQINYRRITTGNELEIAMDKHFHNVGIDDIDICDVILFHIDKNLQHVGIISEANNNMITIIHALIETGKVVKQNLDGEWISRIHKIYRFRELIIN